MHPPSLKESSLVITCNEIDSFVSEIKILNSLLYILYKVFNTFNSLKDNK